MEKVSKNINIFLFIIINTIICHQVMAESAKPPGKIAYEDRIQFVKTLIEKSSATKQIDSSGNAEALAHRDVASAHFEKAQQAFAAGEVDTANNELLEATKIMFEAVRMAKKEEFTDDKKKRDYADRLDSINALMEAHHRVTEEKGKQSDGKELKEIVAEKVKTANLLFKEGKLGEARSVLDEAYVAAKIAINTIRGGDTLVRSLHFETKEQEYHYEIDRNDTHKMLLLILNKKNDGAGSMSEMTQTFLDKAAALRAEAEKQATAGNHEAAIHTLEESTKNLVRALRGSGIFIPG